MATTKLERALNNIFRKYKPDDLGICSQHCSVCEGMDHHWMPECDDERGPFMVCKHCSVTRPMTDDDDEEWDL